jgi:hypothetical protein
VVGPVLVRPVGNVLAGNVAPAGASLPQAPQGSYQALTLSQSSETTSALSA